MRVAEWRLEGQIKSFVFSLSHCPSFYSCSFVRKSSSNVFPVNQKNHAARRFMVRFHSLYLLSPLRARAEETYKRFFASRSSTRDCPASQKNTTEIRFMIMAAPSSE